MQGHDPLSHIVKMHYYYKNLLYSWAQFRQIRFLEMMTKECSTKIVNFMSPRSLVLVLGFGRISVYVVKSIISLKICSTTWHGIEQTNWNMMSKECDEP